MKVSRNDGSLDYLRRDVDPRRLALLARSIGLGKTPPHASPESIQRRALS
jgi:hypothetical protein